MQTRQISGMERAEDHMELGVAIALSFPSCRLSHAVHFDYIDVTKLAKYITERQVNLERESAGHFFSYFLHNL